MPIIIELEDPKPSGVPMPETMEVQNIPVADILPPIWNSRSSEPSTESVQSLADTIQRDGLKAPIRVIKMLGAFSPTATENGTTHSQQYRLTVGSRRLAAFRLLGRSEIPAVVTQAQESETDQTIENIIENVQRSDLTTFELARSVARLRELKYPLKDIGKRIGISDSHVSNLGQTYGKLDSSILEAWRKGESATQLPFLRELSQKTPEIQKVMYAQRVELLKNQTAEDETETDEKEEKDENEKLPVDGAAAGIGPPTRISVKVERHKTLVKALKKVGGNKLALLAVKYLVGEIDAIPGVIEAPKVEKPAKKDKE